jgi:glutaconate CoA-transferase subunit B
VTGYRSEELLITTIAALLDGLGHVAVGSASPIPGAAALLSRRRAGGRLRVSVLGSTRHTSFTDGSRELFDCAAQGRIDAFFLGGVQIDGGANINLVGVGGYPRSQRRFPGSFGSSYLYFLVPRVILFTLEHSRRVLVPRVEFISAPGTSPPGVYRPGGPHAMVTPRCVFHFRREAGRFALASLHPGVTLEEIREHTGFDFDVPASLATTPEPTAEELSLIRGPVGAEIGETYPAFARRVLGLAPTARSASA